ncbi:MAG: hypothetical protein EZS28_012191 [Streblomastix strix]|uniref:Uncharacterized protein n=1 Tax=Streblomastix strix TaxID=222440 RepID=A0A5J4WBK5_9EUKA|nr:MAG: hypothetical protein EZS28_012191 [Streblomastix strix]
MPRIVCTAVSATQNSTFPVIFKPTTPAETIAEKICKPMIEGLLNGENQTLIFIEPPPEVNSTITRFDIIRYLAEHVFLAPPPKLDIYEDSFLIKSSYLEVFDQICYNVFNDMQQLINLTPTDQPTSSKIQNPMTILDPSTVLLIKPPQYLTPLNLIEQENANDDDLPQDELNAARNDYSNENDDDNGYQQRQSRLQSGSVRMRPVSPLKKKGRALTPLPSTFSIPLSPIRSLRTTFAPPSQITYNYVPLLKDIPKDEGHSDPESFKEILSASASDRASSRPTSGNTPTTSKLPGNISNLSIQRNQQPQSLVSPSSNINVNVKESIQSHSSQLSSIIQNIPKPVVELHAAFIQHIAPPPFYGIESTGGALQLPPTVRVAPEYGDGNYESFFGTDDLDATGGNKKKRRKQALLPEEPSPFIRNLKSNPIIPKKQSSVDTGGSLRSNSSQNSLDLRISSTINSGRNRKGQNPVSVPKKVVPPQKPFTSQQISRFDAMINSPQFQSHIGTSSQSIFRANQLSNQSSFSTDEILSEFAELNRNLWLSFTSSDLLLETLDKAEKYRLETNQESEVARSAHTIFALRAECEAVGRRGDRRQSDIVSQRGSGQQSQYNNNNNQPIQSGEEEKPKENFTVASIVVAFVSSQTVFQVGNRMGRNLGLPHLASALAAQAAALKKINAQQSQVGQPQQLNTANSRGDQYKTLIQGGNTPGLSPWHCSPLQQLLAHALTAGGNSFTFMLCHLDEEKLPKNIFQSLIEFAQSAPFIPLRPKQNTIEDGESRLCVLVDNARELHRQILVHLQRLREAVDVVDTAPQFLVQAANFAIQTSPVQAQAQAGLPYKYPSLHCCEIIMKQPLVMFSPPNGDTLFQFTFPTPEMYQKMLQEQAVIQQQIDAAAVSEKQTTKTTSKGAASSQAAKPAPVKVGKQQPKEISNEEGNPTVFAPIMEKEIQMFDAQQQSQGIPIEASVDNDQRKELRLEFAQQVHTSLLEIAALSPIIYHEVLNKVTQFRSQYMKHRNVLESAIPRLLDIINSEIVVHISVRNEIETQCREALLFLSQVRSNIATHVAIVCEAHRLRSQGYSYAIDPSIPTLAESVQSVASATKDLVDQKGVKTSIDISNQAAKTTTDTKSGKVTDSIVAKGAVDPKAKTSEVKGTPLPPTKETTTKLAGQTEATKKKTKK